MELQKFWNDMYTTFTFTLKINQGLGDYDSLTATFSAQEKLIPPKGHTHINQAMNAYKNFTRVLRDHLLKKDTISKESSQKVYTCLIKKPT